ncbi:hypothetical protein COP1_014407 [Malus domestica]
MERHIEIFLKRLSYVAILIDTVTFVFILLKTPDTYVAPGSSPKPHFCFPKSSCDASSHQGARLLEDAGGLEGGVVFIPFFVEDFEIVEPALHKLLMALTNGLKQRSEKAEAREVLELLLDTFHVDLIQILMGFMVAFTRKKYAARSIPTFVANGTYTVTTFTIVLEFNKGRLQNLCSSPMSPAPLTLSSPSFSSLTWFLALTIGNKPMPT